MRVLSDDNSLRGLSSECGRGGVFGDPDARILRLDRRKKISAARRGSPLRRRESGWAFKRFAST